MFERTVSGITLTLLLIGMLTLAFNIQSTRAQVELTVFGLWGGVEEQNFLQVLANFTGQTGITVNYTRLTYSQLESVVETEFQGSTSSADMILAPWPEWILNLASQGHLIEATSLINASKYPTHVIASVTDGEGKMYAAPFKLFARGPGFWYKKSFFAAHNLTVPTTFDEFNNTLLPTIQMISGIEQAIASGNGIGWPLSDTTEAYIIGLGGYRLQEDLIIGPRVRNWTDTEVVNVFEQLRRELAAGYFSPPAEWTSQITKFWDEKYGIYFMGSWMTTMGQIGNVSDLDFFAFPETDGVAGSVDYSFVPKYTEHPDEAKLLLQYLASAEAQEGMVRLGGGFLAANIDVPADAYRPIDRRILDFISQPSIHIVPDLDDAIGGTFQTTFWDQLKLLWVDPSAQTMNNMLGALEDVALQQQGTGFWTVDDDGPADFNTIQEAINAADPGDTILVSAGTYHKKVWVNKSVSLIGEGAHSTCVFQFLVRADNVTINGFTTEMSVGPSIELTDSDGCNISNNIAYGLYYAVNLYNSRNNFIGDNEVFCQHGECGITLYYYSDNNIIRGNYVENGPWGIGISLVACFNNLVEQNEVVNFCGGIMACYSDCNVIQSNIIENCEVGIILEEAKGNDVFHNNLINNYDQAVDAGRNAWDNGAEGNYWSDYAGVDSDGDGIGDTPYIIDADNQDRYPLMNPWGTGTPVASFTWSPAIPKADELVAFDASSSTSIGGTITKYYWDFGDGKNATGQIATHAYASSGTYTVTLNTTDSEGLWDIEQKQIQVVQPYGPEAEFTWIPSMPKVGDFAIPIFDASASTSGWNGTHEMPITEYCWNFGDGNKIIRPIPIVQHIFGSSGNYCVTLTVYALGATPETDSITHKVTVTSVPVGGYSIPIKGYTTTKPLTLYLALIAILTASFTIVKRRKKQQN